MAKSYRKPYNTENYGNPSKKFHKRKANKKIRQLPIEEHVEDGGSFKNIYCSYYICDFKFYQPDSDYHFERK